MTFERMLAKRFRFNALGDGLLLKCVGLWVWEVVLAIRIGGLNLRVRIGGAFHGNATPIISELTLESNRRRARRALTPTCSNNLFNIPSRRAKTFTYFYPKRLKKPRALQL